MEEILSNPHITASHMVVIIVLLTCHLLFKMGLAAWDFVKQKNEASNQTIENLSVALEQLTTAMAKLESQIECVQKDLNELPKIKKDLSRVFTAAKILAGNRWGDIRKEFDDL